jgi:hypothetical protein
MQSIRWKDLKTLAPEVGSVDIDEASGTAAILMTNGTELFAEWDADSLWLNGLLGVPHAHSALQVYETLLAFVANPRKRGGLIIAGSGSGKPLAVITPVTGFPQSLSAPELAQDVVRFGEITAALKRYVASPDTFQL